LGVALIPRLAAQTEIARKQLAGLAVKEMRLERRVHLIYRKGATLSHAAKAFLTVARGKVGQSMNDKHVKDGA
jgi:DNA-binding transcriptional LysR family regulator